MGGLDDSKIDYSRPHARIFATDADRIAAGYEDGNGVNGDLLAINGTVKIGLVYHGAKNLTPAQARYFGA